MSYFEDASLVLIPSAQKLSKIYSVKPTDGTGDLTFTRSNDTATRVGPDGLIEKVRTNLILSSNNISTQSTYWRANQSGTTTQNAAVAPDGTTTAALITPDGVGAYSGVAVTSTITLAAVPHTYSVYLKTNSGTASVSILVLDSAATFHQVNVTATTTWTRFSISFTAAAGAAEAFVTSSGALAWLAWGAQLETGDIVTNLIPTTTAAVSVGPVANVPRLDYLGSSCPRLLLEPQRTNLALYSEQFDNTAWSKGGTTISANTSATLDPSGYNGSDKLVEDSSTGVHRVFNISSVVVSDSVATTYSVFAKAAERTQIYLRDNDIVGARFNLSTGAVISTEGTATATITNYGNGWYRCTITRVNSNTSGRVIVYLDNGGDSYTGNGTSGVYIFGAQIETSAAYATSYIGPTLGSAVTRGADLAQKTSASALIGQTEGTIFWEIDLTIKNATGSDDLLNLDDGSGFGNTIYLYKVPDGRIAADIYVGGNNQGSFVLDAASVNVGSVKMALGYANNNMAFFVNGVQVGTTDTSCSVPAMSRIQLGNTVIGPSFSRTAQVLLFPTRLSDADLAALTA